MTALDKIESTSQKFNLLKQRLDIMSHGDPFKFWTLKKVCTEIMEECSEMTSRYYSSLTAKGPQATAVKEDAYELHEIGKQIWRKASIALYNGSPIK